LIKKSIEIRGLLWRTIKTKGELCSMDRKTLWVSLLGGCFLLILGIKRLLQEGDWVLFILGVLIIAFSSSSLLKNRPKK